MKQLKLIQNHIILAPRSLLIDPVSCEKEYESSQRFLFTPCSQHVRSIGHDAARQMHPQGVQEEQHIQQERCVDIWSIATQREVHIKDEFRSVSVNQTEWKVCVHKKRHHHVSKIFSSFSIDNVLQRTAVVLSLSRSISVHCVGENIGENLCFQQLEKYFALEEM